MYGNKERCLHFIQEEVTVALECMAIRTKNEQMLLRVQFIRRKKMLQLSQRELKMPEDFIPNMGINGSRTGKMMTDIMFRSYTNNNCYYITLEPETDARPQERMLTKKI